MRKEIPFLAALALITAAGCGSTTMGPSRSTATDLSGPPARRTSATIPAPVAITRPASATTQPAPATSQPPAALAIAEGHGWTSAGLNGPVPSPGTCQYRRAANGYLLPDRTCTPGAIDPSVTQATLGSTICRNGGYTASVRPPSRLTDAFKSVAEDAYRDPSSTEQTELDHLVPLELGGASDTRNLWPEPDQGLPAQFDPSDPFGINAKDGVENRLHAAVCAGQVGLAPAQTAIAANWTIALTALGLQP